jgi:hypothetical protein
MNNLKTTDNKLPINQTNLLNSSVSRSYIQNKKMAGLKAKNQSRIQMSKLLKDKKAQQR